MKRRYLPLPIALTENVVAWSRGLVNGSWDFAGCRFSGLRLVCGLR